MKRLDVGMAVAPLVVLGLSPGVRGEPLDLKQVAAKAQWLGHVDFDAMRASIVVQKALAKHLETHKDAEQHRALARTLLGMDPLKDVLSLTVYGYFPENRNIRAHLEALEKINAAYKTRLKEVEKARSDLIQALGTGDSKVIALKKQYAEAELGAAQQELLRFQSELRQLDQERMQKEAAPNLALLKDKSKRLELLRDLQKKNIEILQKNGDLINKRAQALEASRLDFEQAVASVRAVQQKTDEMKRAEATNQLRGVLILHARMDQKKLLGLAEKLPGHEVSRQGPYQLHVWTHKGRGRTHTIVVAFPRADLLVAGSGIQEVKTALEVLDGKSASLGQDAPLAGNIPPGTIALFRAAGIAAAHLPGRSPLVKQLDSFRFVLGEHEGKSFYRARAVTTSTDIVDRLRAVLEGARALAEIHNWGDEQARRLIDGLKVKTEDRTLTVLWSGSAQDVWTLVEKHARLFAEMRAKKGTHGKIEKKGPEKKPISPEEDF